MADVVHPTADLSRYRLVVVPNLYLVGDSAAINLREYARAGGRLLISFFSGIVDETDRVHLGGYPAPFRDLLGLRIDEFWPLPDNGTIGVAFADGTRAVGSVWSEWIEAEGADVLATFTDSPLSGRPAVTRNAFGHGGAWYLGTRLHGGSMRRIVRDHSHGEVAVQTPADGVPLIGNAASLAANEVAVLRLPVHAHPTARAR